MADEITESPPLKKPRGFAAMDPLRHKELSSLGGKTAQRSGTAHRWETGDEQAVQAGRKGGAVVSADSDHMAAIGQRGGQAGRGRRRRSKRKTDGGHDLEQ